MPVLVLPLNNNDGALADPAGSVSDPVKVPPAKGRSREALPVTLPIKFAVIVPAEKFPDASRATMAFDVLRLVADVAEFATFPAVVMVASFESIIPAAGAISLLTIK